MKGRVYLVGAGFGGPEHLTLRAWKVLREAEVVLHDRLVHPGVLSLAKGALLPVGKEGYGEKTPQEAITERLIALAREGRVVARLKGGDPVVFGRGGEEVLVLKRAGIPFEVVPGVTSAVGALSALGLPLTHRGLARSFAVATGHDPSPPFPRRTPWSSSCPSIPWQSLRKTSWSAFPRKPPSPFSPRWAGPGRRSV